MDNKKAHFVFISNAFFRIIMAGTVNTMRKMSDVDSSCYVSEYVWLVSLSNCPSIGGELSYVRVSIEGILGAQEVLVLYRVITNKDQQISRITRKIYNPTRLNGYYRQQTISYFAVPKQCQALDLHLEDLSNLLIEQESLSIDEETMRVFDMKHEVFNWCMDRLQETVALYS